MTRLITATYDGSALQLDEPLPFEPNTRVIISLHSNGAEREGSDSFPRGSFLEVARSLTIDGPSDWSARVDHYLYGPMIDDDDDP